MKGHFKDLISVCLCVCVCVCVCARALVCYACPVFMPESVH